MLKAWNEEIKHSLGLYVSIKAQGNRWEAWILRKKKLTMWADNKIYLNWQTGKKKKRQWILNNLLYLIVHIKKIRFKLAPKPVFPQKIILSI